MTDASFISTWVPGEASSQPFTELIKSELIIKLTFYPLDISSFLDRKKKVESGINSLLERPLSSMKVMYSCKPIRLKSSHMFSQKELTPVAKQIH